MNKLPQRRGALRAFEDPTEDDLARRWDAVLKDQAAWIEERRAGNVDGDGGGGGGEG